MAPVGEFVRHLRRLWPNAGVLLPLPFVVWPIWCLAHGEHRWEQLVLMVGVPVLAYSSQTSKKLFLGLYPIGLLALVYDAMRFVKDVGVSAASVHLCDLRALEIRLFGISMGGTRTTVHDWLRIHANTPLDLLCAVPYGTFLFATVGFAIYLYVKNYSALRRFAWAFLVANLAGFVTYHLYPAAPPWYFHTHGCVVDVSTRASEGPNLARVDALLGVTYFGGLYGRSNDVFGSVPSLHVVYPLLIALSGWRFLSWAGRVLASAFFVTMCFAAVYLDHHWVIDVVLGLSYGLAAWLAVGVWVPIRVLVPLSVGGVA